MPGAHRMPRPTAWITLRFDVSPPALMSTWMPSNDSPFSLACFAMRAILAVFHLDLTEAPRKRLRTTNSLENLNPQIKRRTAVLTEISEEWETGRRYLPRVDA